MYKTFKQLTAIIALTFGTIACNESQEEISNSLPYPIDFEQCTSNVRNIKISEIADSIELIELKSPEELPISMVWNFIPVGDYWFIHASEGIYKFTNKGEYITKISGKGQGPNEYATLFGIAVDTIHNEFLINDYTKLIFFDLDGNYLRMEKKKEHLYKVDFSDTILWATDSGYETNKYTIYGLNEKQDIIYSKPNPFYEMKPQMAGGGSRMSLWKPFYHYKNALYMNGPGCNDTIYQLKGSQCTPYAAFNMGKYKLPLEYEAWNNYEAHWKNGYHYWNIPALTECERYFFILAQRYAPENGDRSKTAGAYRYIMYDKKERNGFMVNENEDTQIVDDILNGPPIWPTWTTKDYYVSVIHPYHYEKKIKEKHYTPSPQLQKVVDSWNYDTNVLVMMCHKKKTNK